MKKTWILMSIAILGAGSLAGCTLAGQTDSTTATSLQKEIGSAALLMKSASSTSTVSFAKRSTSISSSEASPVTFSGTNISDTLASFDALSVDAYSVKSETLTSDKAEYASEEKLTFTLPSGSSQAVTLYYGDPNAVMASIEGSVDVTISTSNDPVSSSNAAETTSQTTGSTSSGNQDDGTFVHYAHGFGYRGGYFAGMLNGNWSFVDDETDSTLTSTSLWKAGLAIIEDVSYHFVSEDLTIKSATKSYDLSSFVLVGERGNFLSVEQAQIENNGKTAMVYAYTSFVKGSYVRMLLQNSTEQERLVYKTPFTKMVIDRYLEEGKTLYAVHLKQIGSMALVGVYEKVVSQDADGNSVVTYVVHEDTSSAPSEE
jgi:hypothetical protein